MTRFHKKEVWKYIKVHGKLKKSLSSLMGMFTIQTMVRKDVFKRPNAPISQVYKKEYVNNRLEIVKRNHQTNDS
ncbi:hypothetical protein CHS0354_042122 [Potamilus streckersoni]|uniref:Uncharacterized protein n=1 Tax=Potamilus streckersoni TaxID=2493646 RepID=A0AAE0WER5_9BIVA|nr:hypothetical protein CHS0354_042122 [Potamilus streckersoni]